MRAGKGKTLPDFPTWSKTGKQETAVEIIDILKEQDEVSHRRGFKVSAKECPLKNEAPAASRQLVLRIVLQKSLPLRQISTQTSKAL